jgi:uncharacterized protein (TIGR04222 family)
MNPLDLRGPEFLQFYLVYGLAGFTAFWILRAFWIHTHLPDRSTLWSVGTYPGREDAYRIAFLRGGAAQVVQTLLGNLVGTGQLALEGRSFRPAQTPSSALLPIEEAARTAARDSADAAAAVKAVDTAVRPWTEPMETELARHGLMPTPEQRAALWRIFWLAMVCVPGMGIAKLLVAWSRGKSNVAFLVILTGLFAFATYRVLRPPRQTPAGKRYLAWLRESHRSLTDRLGSGRAPQGDLALAAGIFGIAALTSVPEMNDLRRAMQPQSSGGDSGSGCGGGDSGGGGGCGGGGCGGCGGS